MPKQSLLYDGAKMDMSSTTRIMGQKALQELHTKKKNVCVGATTIFLHEHAPGAKGCCIGECYLRDETQINPIRIEIEGYHSSNER